MTRDKRTQQTLLDISQHLFYEYTRLRYTANAMASGALGNSALSDAVLESFTLHARNLLDFLYADDPRADDVVAEDFFDDASEWPAVRPVKTELLKTIHRRVGKEVAHLTYVRLSVSAEAKPWSFAQIATEICTVFGVFLEHARKDCLGLVTDGSLKE